MLWSLCHWAKDSRIAYKKAAVFCAEVLTRVLLYGSFQHFDERITGPVAEWSKALPC